MKKTIYLVTLSLLLLNIKYTLAIHDTTCKPRFYGGWTFGGGILFCPNNAGQLSVSFPYTINGTPNNFSGALNNPYHNPNITGNILSVEFGTLHNFFTCNFGSCTVASVKLEVGTGYNFYLDILHNATLSARKKLLVVKPFLNFCYSQVGLSSGDGNIFGTIDNANNYITVFGNTANPTYSYTVHGRTITDDAQVLDVYFRQNNWIVAPGIGISDNPFAHILRIEITLSYYYSFLQDAGIKFNQDKFNSVGGMVPFGSTNLTATFNGKNTYIPYQFSGFYLGLTLGVNFPGSPKHPTFPTGAKHTNT